MSYNPHRESNLESRMAERLGIYFSLDEDEYRSDLALGSTDKKHLLGEPAAYWWDSPLNPLREEKEDSPAMKKGTAVHKFVLEGEEAFGAAYGRCEFKGNVKPGIEERKAMAAVGKEPLASKDYDRIAMAATIIRLNSHIAEMFSSGRSEVSVFWEQEIDGETVRQKARLDYLKVRAVCDLKSHAPLEGLSFEASCHGAMKKRAYAIQAQSYLHARSLIPQFVRDGMVYGDHDASWLKKVADAEQFAFVICFWASKGPPLTWAGMFSPGNPKLAEAQQYIDIALKRYVDFRREFGEGAAWIRQVPIVEFDPENIDNYWRMVPE